MANYPDNPMGSEYNEGNQGMPVGSDNPPAAPPPPSPIDTSIQDLIDMISGEGGVRDRFMSAADRLQAISEGRGDTAFEFEESRALGGVQEQFSRGGMGFSAAAQNAAGRTRQQFGGMRLQRQDAAGEQYLNTLTAGVETSALPAGLLIAQEAAETAGGGGGGGLFNTVICTLLHERGDLPTPIFHADVAYGAKHIGVDTLRGYHAWARPLVRWASRSSIVYRLMRPLGWHWAHHMAYLQGAHPAPDRLGALLLHTIKPLCTGLGRVLRKARARRRASFYAAS